MEVFSIKRPVLETEAARPQQRGRRLAPPGTDVQTLMAILVVEFSREGYKIRKVLARNQLQSNEIIGIFLNFFH